MDWVRDFTDEWVRARESDCFLRREVASLKVLAGSLVWTVGELRDDLARQMLLNTALSRRVPMMEPVDRAAEVPQRLVPYQGRLVPIKFPNRGRVMAVDLSDEEEVEDSEEESSGSGVRDFTAEEEEQAEGSRQRGEVVEHAMIVTAQMDPAPEYEAAPEYD